MGGTTSGDPPAASDAGEAGARPAPTAAVRAFHAAQAVDPTMVVEANGVSLDLGAYLVYRDGELLPPLPLKQFLVLKVLLERAGQVVKPAEIVRLAWGEDAGPGARESLYVHILRLRRLLEPDPRHPIRIRTVRGVGFIFDQFPVPRGVEDRVADDA